MFIDKKIQLLTALLQVHINEKDTLRKIRYVNSNNKNKRLWGMSVLKFGVHLLNLLLIKSKKGMVIPVTGPGSP
jgi:hypothetical protein